MIEYFPDVGSTAKANISALFGAGFLIRIIPPQQKVGNQTVKNKQWILQSPIYVHCKKHFCPFCQCKLDVRRIRRLINSKSNEAKDYDFSFSGGDVGFMFGDVEFSLEVFYCPTCEKEFSIKEMKRIERENRNKK